MRTPRSRSRACERMMSSVDPTWWLTCWMPARGAGNSGPRRGEQRDRVVHLVDPHQRHVADAVRDAGIADRGPEALVAHHVRGAETDVGEAGDAGVARGRVAL